MLKQPRISVIMPVYNSGTYLFSAIESIINQSYKNFELIIINDGSTDESLATINYYKDIDKRIVVISRENLGLVSSLNEGFSIAKGDYIARMDGDDISMPKRFEHQLSWLSTNEHDVCGSWIELLSGSLITKKKYPVTTQGVRVETLFGTPLAHGSAMMTRKFTREFKYIEEWNRAEDYDLWERAISVGYKISNVPKYLYQYRLHKTQTSNINGSDQSKKADIIRERYWKYYFNNSNLLMHNNAALNLRSDNTFDSKNYLEGFKELREIANQCSDPEELSIMKINSRILAVRIASKTPFAYRIWLNANPGAQFTFLERVSAIFTFFALWITRINPRKKSFNKLQNIYLSIFGH